MANNQTNIKHQLVIHFDYGGGVEGVSIKYSYPFSEPHEIPEQTVVISPSDIPSDVRVDLNALEAALTCRIPAPDSVRLPHAEIAPTIRNCVITVVVQDQRRRNIPLARMYYLLEVTEIGSRKEHQVRIEPNDWSGAELECWSRLKSFAKRVAWKDYSNRVDLPP